MSQSVMLNNRGCQALFVIVRCAECVCFHGFVCIEIYVSIVDKVVYVFSCTKESVLIIFDHL